MRVLPIMCALLLLTGCSTLPSDEADGPPVTDTAHPPRSTWSRPIIHPLDVAGEASAVIAQYLELTDLIGADGGVGADRMRVVLTERWYPREREGFDHYVQNSIKTMGTTRFDHLQVQSARLDSEEQVEVAVFLCVDSSAVMVVDIDSPDPPEGLLEWLSLTSQQQAPDEVTAEQWQEFLDDTAVRWGVREPIVVWLRGKNITSLRVDSTENWLGAHPCGEEE